ncbi:efflux RND transporter periplasmic adaptor subunit [Nitratifractor salsuginis]|uniref:Efflux transporter, RND family, MFP subunit n=1 Tax=Nitratifractor salsuginis (strain DSM 16511 / JCM 12458 / E9I37-1) TaxID=749222 RepID=E6X130_NITSE|nr:efflux RND transporter periplasmic adaptor subunit [Nitratifractor salsuginis]ADV45833.1 efflux transporter, RND family, MFP subunit [Nitratifractor salsuginis DSM 16511]
MKKAIKILIFLLILAALIVGAVRLVKKRHAEEAKTPPAKEYAVVISTLKAQPKKVTLTVPSISLTRNDNDAVIASKVAARVLRVPKSGTSVKKGDLIVQLDDTDIKAQLASVLHAIESAKAQLDAAILNLKNLEKIHAHSADLLKIHGVSREQFDAEQVKIDSAKAQVAGIKAQIAKLEAQKAALENQLSYTRITAPVDGIVSQTMVSVGDLATPGKPLVKIAASKGTWLLVRLPGGAEKIFFQGKEYPLKALHSTFNGLNEYRADIDRYIPAGNRVECEVVTYQGKAVLLPFDTLLNREGKNWLFLYQNGNVHPVKAPILATGEQGIALDPSVAGKEIVEAKPDILLRLLGGYPVVKAPGE